MNVSAALKSYGQVKVTAGLEDASSHRLISMLFEGLFTRIAQAKGAMQQKDMETKSNKVTEAMNIVIGLREFLDLENGGELARNLDALYEYVQRTLLQSHIKNDPDKLDECRDLLKGISEAWDQISPQ